MKTKLITLAMTVALLASINAAEVVENWNKHCTSCHGKDGKGQTKMGIKAGAKDYTDPKVQAEMKEENAVKAIKEGMKEGGKEKMKPFGDKLNEDEVKALVAHMRTFKK